MKRYLLFLFGIIITTGILAQTPQGISHQAVMRDAENNLIVESPIGLKVSILQGADDGVAVYIETHNVMTNQNGLISYIIGDGDVVDGEFEDIDWGAGPYFLKTEADPAGGTNYSITGVTQFLSVPYSMHAQTAETLSEEIVETDPYFTANFDLDGAVEGDLLRYNGSKWVKYTFNYMTSIAEFSDEFLSDPGQTVFELSNTPHENSKVKLFINGIRISNTAYSLVGSTVTYHPENNGSFDLTDGDRIQFDYFF